MPARYTHAVVLYQHTIRMQSYSVDQSEPDAEPWREEFKFAVEHMLEVGRVAH